MHCFHCQKEVPSFARVCPYCRNSLMYTPDGDFTTLVVISGLVIGILVWIDYKLGTSLVDSVFNAIEFIGHVAFWILTKIWHALVWIFT